MRLTLEFGDHSLAARRVLQGESVNDPAIVLLHDALGCMETWKEFPQTLFDATGLDVVMFDRRGHGSLRRCLMSNARARTWKRMRGDCRRSWIASGEPRDFGGA
ncbi:MAG: hypothetical protein IPG71_12110 [bacterium]|nr:hypothetical protein [bacterium]